MIMQLEEYFTSERSGTIDSIRIKGTRIGIEVILDRYLEGESPERIYQSYRHVLTLEQVYATITYYLHKKEEVAAYLERVQAFAEAAYQDYLKQERPEVVQRLLGLRALGKESRAESP
jgi:uncharacterized protein (DUF433 family)